MFYLFLFFLKAGGKKVRTTETEVYVIAAQKGMVAERLKLCRELWEADIKVGHRFSVFAYWL